MKTLRNGYKLVLNHEGLENGIVLAMRDDSKKEFVTWITVDNNLDNTAHGNYYQSYDEAFEDYIHRIKNSYDAFGDRFLKGVK